MSEPQQPIPAEQQTAPPTAGEGETKEETAPTTAGDTKVEEASKPKVYTKGVMHTVGKIGAGTGGLCAIKPEFLMEAVVRVSLEGDGTSAPGRGMNKGLDRGMQAQVVGTDAPTFEGEVNFLKGEQIKIIKQIIREGKKEANVKKDVADGRAKRDRDDSTKVDAGATAVATEAPKEEDAVPSPASEPTAEELAVAAAQALKKEEAAAVTRAEERVREREERINLRDKLFRNKSILAPLTTVGNLPFRRIVKDFGCDVTLSEMAMVFNLKQIQQSEWSLLRRHESEGIFGIQLGVAKPDDARVFAKALAASDFSYDYIDINCGCPVDLMVNRGCGCGLYAKRGKMRDVVKELVENQPMPVTIKCRIGEDELNPTLQNCIGDFESWGASAVTVHGRSRKQRYTKLANWNYIERVAKLTDLPVVGNGDIMAFDDVVAHRTACPSVSSFMTGRGALIKPWLFQEWNEQILGGRDISSSERMDMLKKYADYGLKHWGGDERGVMTTRKFMCEWLSFLCRYVPVGILEQTPQRMNDRPPYFVGRDDLETLMASEAAPDWIKITEMILGPSGDKFKFTPKHKSNSYSVAADGTTKEATSGKEDGGGDQG